MHHYQSHVKCFPKIFHSPVNTKLKTVKFLLAIQRNNLKTTRWSFTGRCPYFSFLTFSAGDAPGYSECNGDHECWTPCLHGWRQARAGRRQRVMRATDRHWLSPGPRQPPLHRPLRVWRDWWSCSQLLGMDKDASFRNVRHGAYIVLWSKKIFKNRYSIIFRWQDV